MHKLVHSNKFHNFILFLIIALGMINIIYTFTCTKFNYMSDEIWSYGLSNSFYDPFIYSSGDILNSRTPETYQNINTWITSDTFF